MFIGDIQIWMLELFKEPILRVAHVCAATKARLMARYSYFKSWQDEPQVAPRSTIFEEVPDLVNIEIASNSYGKSLC